MAPFNEAVKVNPVPQSPGAATIYEGNLDPTWNIGNVPCGGYALAIILEACIQHQSSTKHVDPLHISSHFLRPTSSSIPFAVRVSVLKTGKGFTNLLADLVQEDALRVTTHAIFGVNSPTPDKGSMVLEVPSPYARRIPIHVHPSQATTVPMRLGWAFGGNVTWAFDTETVDRNAPNHPSRTDGKSVGGGGTEWSGWFQFQTPTEKLSNVYLPYLADMFMNMDHLLPAEEKGELTGISWYPTMTLAVEFKFPISKLTAEHSRRTAGIYSSGRFVNNPQGRHDVYVEIWSAPSNIGEGSITEEWRDRQICLATATQMALTVPVALNTRNGSGQGKETKHRL